MHGVVSLCGWLVSGKLDVQEGLDSVVLVGVKRNCALLLKYAVCFFCSWVIRCRSDLVDGTLSGARTFQVFNGNGH